MLSNQRRQLALRFLRDAGGSLSARELSERIAEAETGESPAPRPKRQSAYVSLHQTHLPKLDDLGIVEYDTSSKTVRLRERAAEVSVYLEAVPKYGLSWSEFYVGLAVLALLTLVGGWLDVPVLSTVPTAVWAGAYFLLIGGSALYQITRQRSSILHRLRKKRL